MPRPDTERGQPSQGGYRSPAAANESIWRSFVPDSVGARVRLALDLLPRSSSAGSYLDIGCSSGEMTSLCAERMRVGKVHGVDLVRTAEAVERGVEAIEFDLNAGRPLPYPAASFDAVTCFETLEHVYDPDFVVAEIGRVLKPGGRAVLDVPRLDSWMNIFMLTLGYQPPGVECSTWRRYGAINSGSFLTGHMSYFTRRALLEMLTAHGFRIAEFRQASQGGHWLAVQRKLGRRVSWPVRALWRLYDLIPGKKDYLIVAVEL